MLILALFMKCVWILTHTYLIYCCAFHYEILKNIYHLSLKPLKRWYKFHFVFNEHLHRFPWPDKIKTEKYSSFLNQCNTFTMKLMTVTYRLNLGIHNIPEQAYSILPCPCASVLMAISSNWEKIKVPASLSPRWAASFIISFSQIEKEEIGSCSSDSKDRTQKSCSTAKGQCCASFL